jgi:hypothetical protein
MDRIKRGKPSPSMVVAMIALFVALVGTAEAVDGPLAGTNQVGSADIINNEVQTADIRDANLTTADIRASAVTTGKIADGEVRSADVLDGSLTPADLANVEFQQARTARLTDATSGNGGVAQSLFKIGRVGLNAFCTNNGGGSFTAGISPIVAADDDANPRPIMVTDGQGSSADDAVQLVPFDVQFFTILTSSSTTAREASFAILDSQNTSASGVTAVSVDPQSQGCVITAQAVG